MRWTTVERHLVRIFAAQQGLVSEDKCNLAEPARLNGGSESFILSQDTPKPCVDVNGIHYTLKSDDLGIECARILISEPALEGGTLMDNHRYFKTPKYRLYEASDNHSLDSIVKSRGAIADTWNALKYEYMPHLLRFLINQLINYQLDQNWKTCGRLVTCPRFRAEAFYVCITKYPVVSRSTKSATSKVQSVPTDIIGPKSLQISNGMACGIASVMII